MAGKDRKEKLQDVQADVAQVVEDIAGIVDSLVDIGKAEVSDRAKLFEHEVEEKVAAFKEKLGSTQEKSTEAFDEVETYVRENPLLSVLCALGVGFLLGKLLDRK